MYQIGNTFTRLIPAIDIASAMKAMSAEQKEKTSVIGDPIARMMEVHSPGLINAWHQQLIKAVSKPTQFEVRKGRRRIQTLGTAVFEFASDGTVQAYQWIFNDQGMLELDLMPDRTVVAVDVPYGFLWANPFKSAALQTLNNMFPGKSSICGYYIDWAHQELGKLVWTEMVQEAVREQIAQDLNLDAELLQAASKVQLSAQPRVPVRLDAYNHCAEYAKDFKQLLQEAPGLIPLYALLAADLQLLDSQGTMEPTAKMKKYLLLRGIKPAMWRQISHHGTPWLVEALAFYDFGRHNTADIALDALWMAQEFGTAQPVPGWLLSAVMQLGGNPNSTNVNYYLRLDDQFPLCARMGHLVRQADSAELARIQDHAMQIFNWSSDHLKNISPGTVRQGKLDWFIRRAEALAEKQRHEVEGYASWNFSFILDLGSDEVEAVVLNSPFALWQEGQFMRHCVSNYANQCSQGRYLVASIRRKQINPTPAKHTRPLATVGFALDHGAVRLARISGFANTLVGPDIHSLASACLEQLRTQVATHGVQRNRAAKRHSRKENV